MNGHIMYHCSENMLHIHIRVHPFEVRYYSPRSHSRLNSRVKMQSPDSEDRRCLLQAPLTVLPCYSFCSSILGSLLQVFFPCIL